MAAAGDDRDEASLGGGMPSTPPPAFQERRRRAAGRAAAALRAALSDVARGEVARAPRHRAHAARPLSVGSFSDRSDRSDQSDADSADTIAPSETQHARPTPAWVAPNSAAIARFIATAMPADDRAEGPPCIAVLVNVRSCDAPRFSDAFWCALERRTGRAREQWGYDDLTSPACVRTHAAALRLVSRRGARWAALDEEEHVAPWVAQPAALLQWTRVIADDAADTERLFVDRAAALGAALDRVRAAAARQSLRGVRRALHIALRVQHLCADALRMAMESAADDDDDDEDDDDDDDDDEGMRAVEQEGDN